MNLSEPIVSHGVTGVFDAASSTSASTFACAGARCEGSAASGGAQKRSRSHTSPLCGPTHVQSLRRASMCCESRRSASTTSARSAQTRGRCGSSAARGAPTAASRRAASAVRAATRLFSECGGGDGDCGGAAHEGGASKARAYLNCMIARPANNNVISSCDRVFGRHCISRLSKRPSVNRDDISAPITNNSSLSIFINRPINK